MPEPLVLVRDPEPAADPEPVADASVDIDVMGLDSITKTRAEWDAEREQIRNSEWAKARKTFLEKQEKRAKRTADEEAERTAMLTRLEMMEQIVEMALVVAHKPATPEPAKTTARTGLFQMTPAQIRDLGPNGIRNLLSEMWTANKESNT